MRFRNVTDIFTAWNILLTWWKRPSVMVSWNEQKKDVLDVQINLNSVNNEFDIKHVSFSNGQKTFGFDPTTATEH